MSGSLDVLVAEQQKKIDSLARRHVTTLQQRLAAVEATNEALAAFDDDMLQQVIDSGTYLVALNKEVQTQLIPDIFALLLKAEPLTALQKRLLKEQVIFVCLLAALLLAGMVLLAPVTGGKWSAFFTAWHVIGAVDIISRLANIFSS